MNIIIQRNDIKIISFDVFDTVITRSTAEPKGVFDIVAAEIMSWRPLLPDDLLDDFTRQRMQAERKARRLSTKEDINLDDIYAVLARTFNLSPAVTERVKALEIKTELDCVVGIPKNINLIAQARKAGKRVIFISDMYLPRPVIAGMLRKAGALDTEDGVYVSGEYGLNKGSGRLFRHVLEAEQCLHSEILHIGDNRSSDFRSPRRLGINAMHVNEACLNRYEAIHLTGMFSSLPAHHRQILAGTSRRARLEHRLELNQSQETIFRLGTSIAGPMLYAYALWLAREADKRGIRRLYFMARDGQVILETTRRVLAMTGHDLELRYLYGSRQAWNLPSIIELEERELDWMTHAEPYLTVRLLSTRLGLETRIMADHLRRAGFSCQDEDERLPAHRLLQLRQVLRTDAPTRELIMAQALSARTRLLAYLDREELTDGRPFALVDTGWFARSQVRLKKILDLAGRPDAMSGFYFGLRARNKETAQQAYFFDTDAPPVYQEWGKAFITIFEVLCSADHGMTLGYEVDAHGRIAPVLKEQRNTAALEWGLDTLRRGIGGFLDAVPQHAHDVDPVAYREVLLEMVRQIISRPDPGEAEVLGGFRFSSEQTEAAMAGLAPPLSLGKILESVLDRSGTKRKAITYWPEASILRSGPLVRAAIPLGVVRPFMRLFGNTGRKP